MLEKLNSAPQPPYLPKSDHEPPSSNNSQTSSSPETQTSTMFVSPSAHSRLTVPTGLDQPGRRNDLIDRCYTQVTQICLGHYNPPRLHVLFQQHPQIFLDYLCIYQAKFPFRQFLKLLYKKLLKSVTICLKHCKRVSTLLIKHKIVCKYWLHKQKLKAPVQFSGAGKMLAVKINGIKTHAILDTGSTYTLLPYLVWKKLGLPPNLLDKSVLYNIKSASHKNLDAVLGTLTLTMAITVENGKDQLMEQKCLVLRPDLKLDIILLGTDFLHINGVEMKYDRDNTKQYKINDIPVVLLTEPIDANLMTWYPDSFLANTEINQSTSFLTTNDSFSEILHAQKGSRENPPQKMNDVETKNPQQIQEFFRLDTEQIDDLTIN